MYCCFNILIKQKASFGDLFISIQKARVYVFNISVCVDSINIIFASQANFLLWKP